MTIVTDVYELNLATSGKLKMRATARLAEGGSEATFEACVLLPQGDDVGAWNALANARLLDPEDRRFEAMSLLVAACAGTSG